MPDVDLVEGRRLAIKLGYINEDGSPGPRWAPTYAQPAAYAPVYAQALAARTIMEPPPALFLGGGTSLEISRFALNPGEALYRQMLPGARFAYAAPKMLASGDLPLLTASGADPSVLMHAAWYYRHSAAMTDSRAHVLEIVEQSLDNTQLDPEALQIEAGRDRWQEYMLRIGAWVSAVPQQVGVVPEGNREFQEQMQRLYGPGGGE
jgi:hypothetical protein